MGRLFVASNINLNLCRLAVFTTMSSGKVKPTLNKIMSTIIDNLQMFEQYN